MTLDNLVLCSDFHWVLCSLPAVRNTWHNCRLFLFLFLFLFMFLFLFLFLFLEIIKRRVSQHRVPFLLTMVHPNWRRIWLCIWLHTCMVALVARIVALVAQIVALVVPAKVRFVVLVCEKIVALPKCLRRLKCLWLRLVFSGTVTFRSVDFALDTVAFSL
jgi:hypothetical protein